MKVTDLARSGDKISLPEKMSIDSAIEMLQRIKKYEEEETVINRMFKGFPWDGALAFNRAMDKMFGWVSAEPTPGMFGPTPPKMISVPTGPGESTLVPMGRFTLPGITGFIQTGVTVDDDGRGCFKVDALVKRKHEDKITALFELADTLLVTESVYRGKAFKLRLADDRGHTEPMNMPKFLPLSKVKPGELVFSDAVQDMVGTNLFTPIEHTVKCREFKIPLKRGVLLYGPYGTGKTLVAHVTAKKCTENGWTFLYCERASELAEMVKLAYQYQPAVVFCEDIDRSVSGERSVEMDDILNIIDGIESKSVELMVILTTNHVENINKALLRPGRLDAVIHVLPPDAKAVEKLLRIYGRGLIPTNANLAEVGRVLEGTIPAVVRECAERAKLSQIKLGIEEGKLVITPEALLDASKGMKNQLDLLRAENPVLTPSERLGTALQEVVQHSFNGDLDEIKDLAQSIRDNQ